MAFSRPICYSTSMQEGVRINKYLADHKICTRKKADDLIERGLVLINGKPAKLGQKVTESDRVEVADIESKYKYFMYNKPMGIVTHSAQEEGQQSIADILPREYQDLFPVGRLDMDSKGLILLTNDGRVVDRLLNPKYEHEKEYLVGLNKLVKPDLLRRIKKGIFIGDYKTKPAKAVLAGEKTIKIILIEGKNHQIRRMVTACGFEVKSLTRTRIMNLRLGGLKPGELKELGLLEKKKFLTSIGL